MGTENDRFTSYVWALMHLRSKTQLPSHARSKKFERGKIEHGCRGHKESLDGFYSMNE
jgi:hypothetical protein